MSVSSGKGFDFLRRMSYLVGMDIANISTAMSQIQVQQDAGAKVQRLAMDTAEIQGEGLRKLMDGAQAVQDPSLGQQVNILA